MSTQISTDPEHIAVSKSKGIEIDWKDGHHSSYDLEYLRNWSLGMDLLIIARTAKLMFFDRNAY